MDVLDCQMLHTGFWRELLLPPAMWLIEAPEFELRRLLQSQRLVWQCMYRHMRDAHATCMSWPEDLFMDFHDDSVLKHGL